MVRLVHNGLRMSIPLSVTEILIGQMCLYPDRFNDVKRTSNTRMHLLSLAFVMS